MTREEIDAVLERVKTRPIERQAYAANILREIEQEEAFDLSEEDLLAIDEAIQQADRGEFATDDEVAAVFNRYRV